MLSLKARVKSGLVTFVDRARLSDQQEYEVLVTFLDENVTQFDDRREQDGRITPGALHSNLSDKEVEILKLAQTGLSGKEIAAKLGTGYHTVMNCLSIIYRKLKVKNRMAAIVKAREYGLLD